MWSDFVLTRGIALVALVAFCDWSARATEFKLLDLLTETTVARIDQFIAAEAFEPGKKIGARKLSAVGLNFSEHFLRVVEKDVPATTLKAWELLYAMSDASLSGQFGGDDRLAVPFLASIYRLMEIGADGPSLTDGRSNFAYVRSPVDERLWAVHWSVNYADEWIIGAVYVPHPHLDWRMGSRLLTR